MSITRRRFVKTSAAGLLIPAALKARATAAIDEPLPQVDRELTGKTICGYQAWFNAQGDGRDLGFRHYAGRGARFEPGHCSIDYWPDLSEFAEGERYDTPFRLADGNAAQVYSASQPATIARHFDWMQTHGIDGIAVQRFGTGLRNDRLRAHHNDVIQHVRESARLTGRLWMAMYDLSSMRQGEPQQRVAEDWAQLVQEQGITEESPYLHHRGKPIVALWGVGFTGREYTLSDCAALIESAAMGGRNAVMLGVPYYWREQVRDATDDPALHEVLAMADIISPWAVGRYSTPAAATRLGETHLALDMQWCAARGKMLLPVAFPGFSWHNLKRSQGEEAALDQIPRLGGQFLWSQAEAARIAGAQSLYIAMFDEMDEGTAIFKCTNDPPIGDSPFLTYGDLPSDHYLWLTGQIAQRLRQGAGAAYLGMPQRRG